MRGSHLSRTRTFTAVLALAAAGAVTLSGCGQSEQKVTPAAPPKKQDAFEQRADQIVRDWPKVSPVHGRRQALPLVAAERPGKKGHGRSRSPSGTAPATSISARAAMSRRTLW